MFGFLINSIPSLLRVASSSQLVELNRQLNSQGLPPIAPGYPYNHHYRTTNTPRFVVNWFSVRLTEVYLEFQVNQKEDPMLFEAVRSALPIGSPHMFYNLVIEAQQIEIPITIRF